MITLSHKAKHYGLIALKVFILGITFLFIYRKLTDNSSVGVSELWTAISSKSLTKLLWIGVFFVLATLNWSLEILKWKTVISSFKNISFKESLQQSLASLTVSLATPNRIGEFGAKALYYPATQRRKVLLLNLISNSTQMLVTTIFGMVGLSLVISNHPLELAVGNLVAGIIGLLLLFVIGYRFKRKQLLIKGLTLQKVYLFIKNLSFEVKLKTILYSVLRYLTFCTLFFGILNFFAPGISLKVAVPLITSMYLLVSVIPSIFIFDVVVRSGVAVWLFSLEGISEWPVLCTVMSMWLLNFLLPALWGSAYVISYQPEK